MLNYDQRKALPSDVKTLASIHAICFPKPWTEAQIADSVENATVLVNENGFIVFKIVVDEAELKTIAVLPEAREVGIGSMLVGEMEEYCQQNGVKKIFLEVEADNAPAIRLYDNFGFQVYSQRDHYYGVGRHALLMRMDID